MFFWFIGLSLVIVAVVFSSPALDHRVVIVASLVPLVEVAIGEPRILHSLAAPVVALVIVMLATRGRRLRRRWLLGIPIGLFMHLLLDGIWTDTAAFWWPVSGFEFSDSTIPEVARGGFNVVLEAAGIGALLWAQRAFGLQAPAARRAFVRTGRLPRDPGGSGTC